MKRTNEFREDAVRIALTSGLTRKQVAGDLGVGLSTLNKWITARRDMDVVPREDLSLAQENDRLRRENRLLKEERETLKEVTQFFAGPKTWDLGMLKNTGPAFQLICCARLLASVRAACVLSAVDLPAADTAVI